LIEQSESFILVGNFLLTTAMVISLIIIWVLLRDSHNLLSKRILATIFLCLFFVSFHYYGDLNKVKPIFIIGYLISDSIGFLIGPLLYIYIKSLHQKNDSLLKKHRLHFLPLGIYFLLITLPFFITFWIDQNLFSYQKLIGEYYFLLHIQALYLLVYAVLSLKLLSKYQKAIKENYSNLAEKDLNCIRYFLVAIMVLMSVDLITLFYDLFLGSVVLDVSYITTFVMVLIILYLGYYGFSQSQILLPEYLIEQSEKIPNKIKTHHLTNASNNEIEQLKQSLEQILKEEKPYLNEELTLGILAKMIPTTDKKLSALLNHQLNTTFYDLINHYRVESMKAKMKNPKFEHYTLLAIAFECGFKSKTSFNRIFKKETGLSPSAYKKELIASNATLV